MVNTVQLCYVPDHLATGPSLASVQGLVLTTRTGTKQGCSKDLSKGKEAETASEATSVQVPISAWLGIRMVLAISIVQIHIHLLGIRDVQRQGPSWLKVCLLSAIAGFLPKLNRPSLFQATAAPVLFTGGDPGAVCFGGS